MPQAFADYLLPVASVWGWGGWAAVAAVAQVVAAIAAAFAAWAAMKAAGASLVAQRDSRHALALGLEPTLDMRPLGDGQGYQIINLSPGQGPLLDLEMTATRGGAQLARERRATLGPYHWPEGRHPHSARPDDAGCWLMAYDSNMSLDRIELTMWDSHHVGRWVVTWHQDANKNQLDDWRLAKY